VATWDAQGWSFEAWDLEDAVTRCIDRLARPPVVPDAPMRVRLTVEGT
jgi:hypothetical protein